MGAESVIGKWDPPLEMALKIVGVHAVVLHTGQVLYFSFDSRAVNNKDNFNKFFADPNMGSYQLWDTVSPTAGPVKPVGRNIFCGGQCSLADGSIFVAGGQDGAGAADVTGAWDKLFSAVIFGADNGAAKDAHTYDPVQDLWLRWPDMKDGRYYPTCQTLGDGTAFIAGGLSNLQQFVISGSNWAQNDQFEEYQAGLLELGPTASKPFISSDQYPIIQLLPGTKQLFVHTHRTTLIFDLNTAAFVPGASFLPPAPVGRQTYPMQSGHCLLPQKEGDAPRILIVGGSTATGFDYDTHSDAPAVRGAFIFDFNPSNPGSSSWRTTMGTPTVARLLSDTVLLPDGTVFVVNGIGRGAAAGHSSETVFEADLFDPVTEQFMAMDTPSPTHPRAYHSTAILLPDGRVAIAGNTGTYNNPDPGAPATSDDTSIQVFNPPYLFRGPRPVVDGVPQTVNYGQTVVLTFSRESREPQATKVMMMRPCAVTHSMDMGQRAIQLHTTATRGRLQFTIPSDRSLAPPGFYMLFFLTNEGIPSVASFVQLGAAGSNGNGGNGGDPCAGGPFPTVTLGDYVNNTTVVETFQGDIIVGKIDQHCNVTLTSTCGSITIQEKCDQHCNVNLTAKNTVTIGQKIDQHCSVNIIAGGDVSLGQKIDGNSSATISTSGGNINIGQKIDGNSSATLKAPNGSINITQKVDGNSVVIWSAHAFNCPDTSHASITEV